MDPLLFTSLSDYDASGPLPWLDGHSIEQKTLMHAIICNGMKENLTHNKIAMKLNETFPELKIKSPLPHATWFFTEVVITEMRIRTELGKYQAARKFSIPGNAMKKKWNSSPDCNSCEICKTNSEVGWIDINDTFPSGHLYAPAHKACRCSMVTKAFKVEDGKHSGLPKDRWIVDRKGDTVTIKRNPKYETNNENQQPKGLFQKLSKWLK